MAFQLIIGTTGTGKTTYAFSQMIDRIKVSQDMEIYIVPEQYTMQAQEEFIQKTKSKGMLNVEVVSFNRLVYRFYDEMALVNKKSMSENGRSLIIRKIIESHIDEFVWIKRHRKKQSYMEELNTLISECYQYTINEDTLEEFIGKIDEKLLKDKLLDLKTLLFYFKKEMKDEFVTTSEASMKLIELIPTIDKLKNTSITIDSFYGFTPMQYKFIEALMTTSKNLYICITIDSKEKLGNLKNENELFYESKKMISRLRDIAELNHVLELEPVIKENILRNQSKQLKHIVRNLFKYPIVKYKNDNVDKSSGIRLMEASTILEEVEAVAIRIHKIVKSNKRFKDIVVLTSDLSAYESAIKQWFDDYEFSYFIDKKDTINKHSLIQFILSALLVVQYNYRYEHVFYHLKSIYYKQTDKLHLIENYCFQKGIKGHYKWNKEWDEYEEDKLELMKYIFILSDSLKKAKTVAAKIKVLYNYLEELKVVEIHEKMTEQLETEDKLQEAVEYLKVYKLVIELLEDTYQLIGEEVVSVKEFVQLIETGLSGIKLSQTPPSIDQIIVGDISRTRFMENKFVFVLGINEGKVPLIVNSNQLLTDKERTTLLELGLEVAPNQAKSLFKEQMNIYMALTKGMNLLHLSYTRSSEEGIMRPAPLFLNIQRMFIDEKVILARKIIVNNKDITRSKPMFYRLTDLVANKDYENHETEINSLFKYFIKRHKENIESMINPMVFVEGLKYINNTTSLDIIRTKEYSMSVSELEAYASCPYSHFLNYRLGLSSREEYVVTLPDIGILFHKCLEIYISKCVYKKIDIAHIKPEVRNALIDECIDEVLKDGKNAIFLSSYRNKYLIIKLTRILKRSLWGIEKQLSKSMLKPKEVEYKFDGKESNIETLILKVAPDANMFLKGVIDRVDEYESDENMYISIIDYKSSNKTLDFSLIDSGVQLQLFVYLNVVKEIKEHNTFKKVIPSGLYYYQIQDPFIKNDSITQDEIDLKLLKQLQPNGLVLHDEQIIRLFDEDIVKTSEVIPVTLTSKGISSRSSTITEEDMAATLAFVNKKSKQIGENIYKGEVEVKPYRYESKTSCDYCKYKAVCRFDSSNNNEKFKEIDKKSMKETIEKWEGDSNGKSHKTDNGN